MCVILLQAVTEVAASLQPVFKKRPELLPVFERMCEPERQVTFRVAWLDDNNEIQVGVWVGESCRPAGGVQPAERGAFKAVGRTDSSEVRVCRGHGGG